MQTPYVCVHQHDLEFMFDFDLPRVLRTLEDSSNPVQYVGMPLFVNLHYEDIAFHHHGIRVAPVEINGLKLMPIIFWYDSTHITSVQHYRNLIFGPEDRKETKARFYRHPLFRECTSTLGGGSPGSVWVRFGGVEQLVRLRLSVRTGKRVLLCF